MSGLFPRVGAMRETLDGWADILRDECIDTDPICGSKKVKDGASVLAHTSYFERLTGDFAKWVQEKARLDTGSGFVTAIPTSISGTVQDYATIGTETPSGSVTLSPDWTKTTDVVAATSTTTKPLTTSSGVPRRTRHPLARPRPRPRRPPRPAPAATPKTTSRRLTPRRPTPRDVSPAPAVSGAWLRLGSACWPLCCRPGALALSPREKPQCQRV
ncbi:hypothetical protein MN608_00682 [Microdochium nivale]|nr:hypothetical protein MN608_00682 [Microdochium nivale]